MSIIQNEGSKRLATQGEAGVTRFGRAMYELKSDTFCANSTPADLNVTVERLAQQNVQTPQPQRKPGRRSARVIA